MSSEWETLPIGEACDFFNGKGISKSDYVETAQIPVMGANGILGFTDKSLIDTPATLIGRVGSCGAIHKTTGACWVSDNAIIAKASDRCLQEFLHYFFKSIDFFPLIQGSTQPLLTQRSLLTLTIDVPSINEQKAIAQILGALDDKIELNRKTNKTLEGIAKALFKSWFVDFDPVRAKAEGRPTGLPDEISELFPDLFDESELGEIPSGWDYKKMSEWGATICGKTPPTKDESLYGGNHLFVTIPDLHEGPFISHASKTLSDAGAESQSKKRLPAGSVMVSCIATPGLVGIARVDCFTNQQINSIIPSDKESKSFLLFSMIESKDLLLSLGGGGSVFFNLSKGRFDDMEILCPSKLLVNAFGRTTSPLIDKCFALKEESRTLSSLRDALLPRLISGELRVPDAEKMLEEAGI